VAELAERLLLPGLEAVQFQFLMSELVMAPNAVVSWSSMLPDTVQPLWTEVPEREFEIE
jgi:hypothetical protein